MPIFYNVGKIFVAILGILVSLNHLELHWYAESNAEKEHVGTVITGNTFLSLTRMSDR